MPTSKKFIKDYGDLSFTEMPFCDVDNVALCQIYYLPFEKTAPNSLDDEPVAFDEVYNKYFELCGNKHKAVGVVLPKKISIQAMKMSKMKRYAEMKIVGATETFSIDPPIQFGAATFMLPDGTLVVMFRGTDDSLIGWIEDVDIYTHKGIPSHQLAVDYLNAVGKKFEGDIIICGHSKGGNVALYGALNCDPAVRSRIRALYNNDGPGFHNFDYLTSREYREIRPVYRHFIPQGSLVGVLLAHDEDYDIVKSRFMLGPTQHDMANWKVEGTRLVLTDKLSPVGMINDRSFSDFIFNLSEEDSVLLENVVQNVVKGTGQLYITDFVKNIFPSMNGASKAWKELDDTTKTGFKASIGTLGKLFLNTARMVQEEALPILHKRIENITAYFA